VVYDGSSNLLLAASAWGLGISADKGESWRYHTDGLHGRYLRAVTVAGDVIFATASTGPSSTQAAVYRTPLDGAQPFELCSEGLPEWLPSNIDTHCIAGSGDMVVFGTAEGTLYRSNDVGTKWETIADDLPAVRCVAVG
jgi:hypothetical protein